VVFTEEDTRVGLQLFDPWGTPSSAHPVDVSANWRPTADASPVVAALPGEQYAVAWTDGNPPRVVLRTVSASGVVGEGLVVHAVTAGPKREPDLVWTGSELVVAWSDGVDILRPVITHRRFDAALTPLGTQAALGNTGVAEGYPALCGFGGAWAAAWRAVSVASEVIHVRAGQLRWETEPHGPGIPGDRPALVELDAQHMLLVFSAETDPADGAAAGAQHLRAALLDVSGPGVVSSWRLTPLTPPYATDFSLSQSRPDVSRVGDRILSAPFSSCPPSTARRQLVRMSYPPSRGRVALRRASARARSVGRRSAARSSSPCRARSSKAAGADRVRTWARSSRTRGAGGAARSGEVG
jgi:hypothetical protein